MFSYTRYHFKKYEQFYKLVNNFSRKHKIPYFHFL